MSPLLQVDCDRFTEPGGSAAVGQDAVLMISQAARSADGRRCERGAVVSCGSLYPRIYQWPNESFSATEPSPSTEASSVAVIVLVTGRISSDHRPGAG